MKEDKLFHIISILKIPLVGPVSSKSLIAYCGSPASVFEQSKKSLLKIPGIGPVIANNILQKTTFKQAEKEMQFLQKNEVQAVTFLDEDYPKRLLHHNDSPILLFHKGKLNLNHPRTIGIVGTRKPSNYGKIITEQFIEDLIPYDVQIISGLAFGVDAAAHTACVHKKVETIGILGHSLDRIYPAAHRKLAKAMTEKGGVISEFMSGTKPDRENFPMRNRIIAGMCDAIIVVESGRKGGSIITAEIANSYNKDVFAFPGRIHDEKSEGTNALIKQHKANLIQSAEDIGYIMRWEKESSGNVQLPLFMSLDENQQAIYDLIKGQKNEVAFDYLHRQCKLQISELSSTLLTLEFEGVIKSLPGKMYIAVR